MDSIKEKMELEKRKMKGKIALEKEKMKQKIAQEKEKMKEKTDNMKKSILEQNIEQAKESPKKMESKFLGEPYQYNKKIMNPDQVGMSSEGSFSAITRNVGGLMKYVSALISGGNNAAYLGMQPEEQ